MRFTGASRTVVGTGVVAALALSAAIAPARPSSAAPPAGVSATISAPGFPAIVAAGYGSVWIAGHRSGVLYRVNPRTNRVTGKLLLPGPINGSLTLAGGVVWAESPAPDGSAAYVYRIDPWKMRILGRHEGVTVAVAASSWWLSSFQQPALLRIKPSTRRVVARITKFGVNSAAGFNLVTAAGLGSVWVYSPDNAVIRISTATNRVTAVIPLPGSKSANSITTGYLSGGPTAITGGYVWVANPAGLYRIDPQSNSAELLPIKFTPFSQWGLPGIATGADGTLFVRTSDDAVTQVDPKTGHVLRSYPAAGGGGEIAVGFGSLWVANAVDDTVSRIQLS